MTALKFLLLRTIGQCKDQGNYLARNVNRWSSRAEASHIASTPFCERPIESKADLLC